MGNHYEPENFTLVGDVRMTSLLKGNTSWKKGCLTLSQEQSVWKIGLRFDVQKTEPTKWKVKRVASCNLMTNYFLVNFDDTQLIVRNWGECKVQKFKELLIKMKSGNMPIDKHSSMTTTPGASQRVPLSPRQSQQSQSQMTFRTPTQAKWLHNSSLKSSEQLANRTSTSFYGAKASMSAQRVYGAAGVNSIKRTRRPGLLPDPSLNKRPSLSLDHSSSKRPRKDVVYDWGKKVDSPIKSHLKGFSNLGNTCYMNASLQSLLHLPAFCEDVLALLKQSKNILGVLPAGKLYTALGRLVMCMRGVKGTLQNQQNTLSAVKSAISASARRFSGNQQHDAHEFLAQVLDQLKDEIQALNKSKGKKQSPVAETNGDASSPEFCTPSQEECPFSNPTVNNFVFGVMHTIECLTCGTKVQKEEKFNDLSLDIPPKITCIGERTLQDALDFYFQDENIDYKCEHCETIRAHVTHTFTHLPRVLVIHLKRYVVREGSLFSKSGGATGIPRFVSLQAHCNQLTAPCLPPDLRSPSTVIDLESEFTSVKENLDHKEHPRRKLDFKLHASVQDVDANKLEYSLPDINPSNDLFSNRFAVTQVDGTSDPVNESESKPNQQTSDDVLSIPDDFDVKLLEEEMDQEMEEEKEQPTTQQTAQESDSSPVENSTPEHPNVPTSPPPPLRCTQAVNPSDLFDDYDETTQTSNGLKTPPRTSQTEGEHSEISFKMAATPENKEAPISIPVDEDEELKQALEMSLREQDDIDKKLKDDLQRAKQLSLQDMMPGELGQYMSDEEEESPCLPQAEQNSDEIELEKKRKAESGELPYTYQLVSVVSHLGSSSSLGHYVADVLDLKRKQWYKFDDSDVCKTTEKEVCLSRQQTGYVFFYTAKEVVEELGECFQHGLDSPSVK